MQDIDNDIFAQLHWIRKNCGKFTGLLQAAEVMMDRYLVDNRDSRNPDNLSQPYRELIKIIKQLNDLKYEGRPMMFVKALREETGSGLQAAKLTADMAKFSAVNDGCDLKSETPRSSDYEKCVEFIQAFEHDFGYVTSEMITEESIGLFKFGVMLVKGDSGQKNRSINTSIGDIYAFTSLVSEFFGLNF